MNLWAVKGRDPTLYLSSVPDYRMSDWRIWLYYNLNIILCNPPYYTCNITSYMAPAGVNLWQLSRIIRPLACWVLSDSELSGALDAGHTYRCCVQVPGRHRVTLLDRCGLPCVPGADIPWMWRLLSLRSVLAGGRPHAGVWVRPASGDVYGKYNLPLLPQGWLPSFPRMNQQLPNYADFPFRSLEKLGNNPCTAAFMDILIALSFPRCR